MKFTQRTKEELIKDIIGFLDPEIVGFSNTMVIFSLEKEDVPSVVYRLRNEKYLRAEMDWTYFDGDGNELDWKEVPREEFLKEASIHYNLLTLDRVRVDYQQHRWHKSKINQINVLESTISMFNNVLEKALKSENVKLPKLPEEDC